MSEKSRSWLSLFISVALCLGVGGAASWVTSSSVATWYPTLDKPAWTPPGWLFGPVWTALYVMMGFALWLVWTASRGGERRVALVAFSVQLVLNGLWSLVFFGLRLPGWAALEILTLWIAIVVTIGAFLRVRRAAAVLLAPYLAWVSFAAALNITIWLLN